LQMWVIGVIPEFPPEAFVIHYRQAL